MRLCAALALVLVALVALTVKAVMRPRRHAPPPDDVAEVVAPPQPIPARVPGRSLPARRPPMRIAQPLPQIATIAGHVRIPDGASDDVEVVAWLNGAARVEIKGVARADSFRVEGLTAGKRYDVELRGAQTRTLRLIGVVAPAEDLDVALEPRAVMRVAVGFPRGETCPVFSVMAHAGDRDEGRLVLTAGSADCRFDVPAPVDSGRVTVVADGDLHLESVVNVPDHGDPEPICLNPPCRANPLEGKALLRVVLGGVPAESPIKADVVPVGDASSRYGCGSSIFTCQIEALPPGQTFSVTASGRNCSGGPVTVTLVEGDNDVIVACVPPTPAVASVPDDPPSDPDL